MTFTAVIKHCLTSGFIDFRGRASRGEYWCFLFFCVLMWSGGCWLLEGLNMLPGLASGETPILLYIYKAGTAAALLLLPPFCAVHVRRLHDMNRSGLRLLPMGVLLVLCTPLLMSTFWASMLADTMPAHLEMPLDPVEVLAAFVRRTVFAAGTLAANAQLLGLTQAPGPAIYLSGNLFPWLTAGYTFFNLVLGGSVAYMSRRGVDEGNRYGPAPAPLSLNPAGTDFLSSLLRCLGHGYIRFRGRAPRSEFWWFRLAQDLVGSAWLFSMGGGVGLGNLYSWPMFVWFVMAFLPYIVLVLPSLSVTVRRLHDRGKNGSCLVVLLVAEGLITYLTMRIPPSASAIISLFFLCLMLAPNLWLLYQLLRRGISGYNDYGPDPLERPDRAAMASAAHAGQDSPPASREGENPGNG